MNSPKNTIISTPQSNSTSTNCFISENIPREEFEKLSYEVRLKWAYNEALKYVPSWKHREIKDVLNDPWNKHNDPEKNDANHRFFAEYFDIVEELADNGPRQPKKESNQSDEEIWKDPPCSESNN